MIIFNANKSTHLSFKCKSYTEYQLDGSDIPLKQLQKDLGVFISSDLTWTSHISYITAKLTKFWIYFDVPLTMAKI